MVYTSTYTQEQSMNMSSITHRNENGTYVRNKDYDCNIEKLTAGNRVVSVFRRTGKNY